MADKAAKLALTRKEVEFIKNYTAGGMTQVQAALTAGYAEKSAARSAQHVLKKIASTPGAYWVNLLNLSGADLATCAKYLSETINREGAGRADKNRLIAIQMVLSAHGIATAKDTGDSNTFKIEGPTMIFVGEDERRKALREGKQITDGTPAV